MKDDAHLVCVAFIALLLLLGGFVVAFNGFADENLWKTLLGFGMMTAPCLFRKFL
jgi:hypothetical protein